MPFIGQPLKPERDGGSLGPPAPGAPMLPRRFRLRQGVIEVSGVLRSWRETGPCRHGSAETYVRKHWFEVLLLDGTTARIYFERQARRGGSPHTRWWLFSWEEVSSRERP